MHVGDPTFTVSLLIHISVTCISIFYKRVAGRYMFIGRRLMPPGSEHRTGEDLIILSVMITLRSVG